MKKTLPKMPRGEGSFNYVDKNKSKIRFRKHITLPTGERRLLSVTAETVGDCMDLMRVKETQTKNECSYAHRKSLHTAMLEWAETSKKPILEIQSYTRLKSTINNQIGEWPTSRYRYQSIKPDEIQKYINDLNNNKNYSHSTIKKVYNSLTGFYHDVSIKEHFDNPMLLVRMPIKSNIKKKPKDIAFLNEEQLRLFIIQATSTWDTGCPRYRYGAIISANMFLGLRIGELLALTWDDVDLDNRVIRVNKTLIMDDSDNTSPSKSVPIVKLSTKTNKNRYVSINKNAYDLICKYKETSMYTQPTDYVIATKTGNPSSTKNISDSIKHIIRASNINLNSYNTHIMRHTCASLFFKNKVPIEIICKILGNSREVCESVYVHFIEDQLAEAASSILLPELSLAENSGQVSD